MMILKVTPDIKPFSKAINIGGSEYRDTKFHETFLNVNNCNKDVILFLFAKSIFYPILSYVRLF